MNDLQKVLSLFLFSKESPLPYTVSLLYCIVPQYSILFSSSLYFIMFRSCIHLLIFQHPSCESKFLFDLLDIVEGIAFFFFVIFMSLL